MLLPTETSTYSIIKRRCAPTTFMLPSVSTRLWQSIFQITKQFKLLYRIFVFE